MKEKCVGENFILMWNIIYKVSDFYFKVLVLLIF